MAELIPLKYRLRVATRHRLELWGVVAVLTAIACVTLTGALFGWQTRTASAASGLREEYGRRSVMIQRSQELRGKREHLAERMQTIQQLMDDKVLLSLLRNVSEAFSTYDCLEYVQVDARGEQGSDGRFLVRITGITNNSTTLAELMTRLGKAKEGAMQVTLESSRREAYLDGQVMRFQITCERGGKKNG